MAGDRKVIRLQPPKAGGGRPAKQDAGPGSSPVANPAQAAMAKHDHALRRFLGKTLGSIAEVDDVLQDVYMRLVRKERQEHIAEFPRSYLFMTATNIVRDRIRRRRVRQMGLHDSFDDGQYQDHAPTAETAVIWQEGLGFIKEALSEMKPDYRLVFLMHRVEGLTFREIADETGIPLRSVQRYASLALAHCKSRLEKKGWFK